MTWDGKPIAGEPPFGATVVVHRDGASGEREFLLLHRAYDGPDYEGDWAWTPPSGARYPGEAIAECARRELEEETGLKLEPAPVSRGRGDWALFLANAGRDDRIRTSDEHDRYVWAPLKTALGLCRPDRVSRSLREAARLLDQG